MNSLKIDTAEMGKIVVILETETKNWELRKEQKFGSQVLLNMIEQILQEGNIKIKDLEAIEVSTGPGSFTGIRVGVSVANALGFSLKIPVNGKKMETELIYS